MQACSIITETLDPAEVGVLLEVPGSAAELGNDAGCTVVAAIIAPPERGSILIRPRNGVWNVEAYGDLSPEELRLIIGEPSLSPGFYSISGYAAALASESPLVNIHDQPLTPPNDQSSNLSLGNLKRQQAAAVYLDGGIVITGGRVGTTRLSDVIRIGAPETFSGNPTIETLASNAAWGPRSGHVMVSHNGALYVFGGAIGNEFVSDTPNDVWRSTDGGATWSGVTLDAGWTERVDIAAASFGGYIWTFGGFDGTTLAEVWRSTDGTAWEQVADMPFGGRYGHGVAVANGTLYLVGGIGSDGLARPDAWAFDGETWTPATMRTPGNLLLSYFAIAGDSAADRVFIGGGRIDAVAVDAIGEYTLPLAPQPVGVPGPSKFFAQITEIGAGTAEVLHSAGAITLSAPATASISDSAEARLAHIDTGASYAAGSYIVELDIESNVNTGGAGLTFELVLNGIGTTGGFASPITVLEGSATQAGEPEGDFGLLYAFTTTATGRVRVQFDNVPAVASPHAIPGLVALSAEGFGTVATVNYFRVYHVAASADDYSNQAYLAEPGAGPWAAYSRMAYATDSLPGVIVPEPESEGPELPVYVFCACEPALYNAGARGGIKLENESGAWAAFTVKAEN